VPAHESSAQGWTVGQLVGAIVALVLLASGAAVSGKMYLRYRSEQAAKAVAIESALVRVAPAMEQGQTAAEKINPTLEEADKVLEAVARDSEQAVAAQKKLARMQEEVSEAAELASNLAKAFATFEKTQNAVGEHSQRLVAIVNAVRQAPSDQIHPYTGRVDPESLKAELAALAALREELALSCSFAEKLPSAIPRARNDLPKKDEVTAELGRFKKLADILAIFEKPVAALTSLEKDILKRVEAIELAENELVRANPRHERLAGISELKDSLYAGRNRLLKTHETMTEKMRDTEKLIAAGDVTALLAGLEAVVPELENASKTADLLVEIPSMLEQSLGSLVRLMVILHQKAFAEKVSVGMEADFTTKWDSVVNKERARVAELYTAAHPGGRMTAEGLGAFEKVDIADISDELQALSTLVNNVNTYLSNAGVFLSNASDGSSSQQQ
jgi:hypothetical protein